MYGYKFGNNTYPRRIRRRSNLGHIFQEKSASYGPGNTVHKISLPELRSQFYSVFIILHYRYDIC